MRTTLAQESKKLAKALKRKHFKLVLAESCTGGMVAAALSENPGISNHFCGSFVSYRNEAKARWLGIPRTLIKHYGAVSPQVAKRMAEAALKKTPEAHIAAAITGHMGPNAPKHQDGLVFVSIATWGHATETWEFHFTGKTAKNSSRSATAIRHNRQLAASHTVLFMVRSLLD